MAKSNILDFVPKTAPPELPRWEGRLVRYSLVPLGSEDVVMSVPVFHVVLHVLATGTAEEQREFAAVLLRMYQGPLVEQV